jgi:limonene-1,2-epoxide hydrolase
VEAPREEKERKETDEDTPEETAMNGNLVLRRSLLAGSGVAALGALLTSREAHAAELSPQEAANLKVVTAFCAAWSTRDLRQVTALMTADSVYRMTETTPPITGAAALIAQMQPWMETSSAIEFRVLETFVRGPMVVNHRIDHFSSTTRPLTWEGVGVFFLQDGKIKEWSDYSIGVKRE